MARPFLYARVSTTGQTTENQGAGVKAAGFVVQLRRIIAEAISGSAPTMQRPAFRSLVDRLEAGDVLVATKLTASVKTPWMFARRSRL